jgi:hypothetical protein
MILLIWSSGLAAVFARACVVWDAQGSLESLTGLYGNSSTGVLETGRRPRDPYRDAYAWEYGPDRCQWCQEEFAAGCADFCDCLCHVTGWAPPRPVGPAGTG